MASENHKNTIFLTKQETERIRNTVTNRVTKCMKLVGHGREPRDLKAAIAQATSASLLADMGGAWDVGVAHAKIQGGTLPALAVGRPYPPCIISLQDLQPMKLADLRMDTHHRGRQLTVKRASPVVSVAAGSWAMVQDQAGDDIERLEVCLHNSRHGEDVLESSSVFVIKEPYFTLTDQGEPTIRVDHPSDFIVSTACLTLNNEANDYAEDAAEAEKIARRCKEEGNAALQRQNLPLAHAKYTQGLKVARQGVVSVTNSDLVRDIFRNRARVNLLLNQLDEAKADAKASFIGRGDQRSKDLDSKAYFRAGCAAYNIGEYREAKTLFEEQQKLTPDDGTSANLRKIEMRLREQEIGTYNWKKIRAGLSRDCPRVNVASFTSNTMVKDSPGRGRGLFLIHGVPAGEIIMCEKAFCVVWGHESEALTAITYDIRDDRIRVSPVGLCISTVQKLLSNPSQIERVMDLYSDYQGDGKNAFRTEDGPVVDTFQVHDIISRNAFSPGSQFGEEAAEKASTGLWTCASYINHSCIANAEKEYIGDLMVLRATRPISAGEEIFASYDFSTDYDARQTALMTTWGFECDCALCVAEQADGPALRKRRWELASKADWFVERESWVNAKKLTIAKAQRLARDLDDTYDDKRYKGVSRLATQRIREWLTRASLR